MKIKIPSHLEDVVRIDMQEVDWGRDKSKQLTEQLKIKSLNLI